MKLRLPIVCPGHLAAGITSTGVVADPPAFPPGTMADVFVLFVIVLVGYNIEVEDSAPLAAAGRRATASWSPARGGASNAGAQVGNGSHGTE